ncbi:FYVE-domain-containing protein [Daldinia caldariorum]|uniref:FYVE-domain-containing protein n=1 Tax=Daldinia caldariorum TaxID=326644 RepID=UPI0020073B17|nr:FYVE-domain-containing protein [Daldinia caldariorum]KAI1465665.1 FYVE-domain-containing protein [Daldinia caldariorum]
MSASNNASTTSSISERDPPQISDPAPGDFHAQSATSDSPTRPNRAAESFDHENQTRAVERTVTGDHDRSVAAEMSHHESSQSEATTQEVNGALEHGVNPTGSNTEYNIESVSTLAQAPSSNSHSPECRVTTDTISSEQPGPAPHSAPHEVEVTNTRGHDTRRPFLGLNPIAPEFTPRPERPPQEITLPRWQPDNEVTFCPICRTQFSFFVRKHHCRKCGRVVCNACSPHRITIPHQYIVRPPGERAFQRYSFLGDEGGIADFTVLGGGEQVRLCNPCVPDPNITPPQTQQSASQFSPRSVHYRSQSSSSGNYNGDNNFSRPPQYLVLPPSHDAYPRSRSVTVNSGASSSRSANESYLSPQRGIFSRHLAYYPQLAHPRYRRTSLLDHHFQGGHPFHGSSFMDIGVGSSSSSSSATMANRPLPPAPQIPEEDECPICHRELPSRELPNFEALRESHIQSCITAHSSYNPSPNAPGRSSPVTRRTGMFPYLATEKDCVDSAECTICLEEFEVGVAMARLECLCRFHRACITAWFVDHPGRCPVHQHDSLGY